MQAIVDSSNEMNLLMQGRNSASPIGTQDSSKQTRHAEECEKPCILMSHLTIVVTQERSYLHVNTRTFIKVQHLVLFPLTVQLIFLEVQLFQKGQVPNLPGY